MNYIIFGGSGFIGTHLIHLLKNECVKPGDRVYDLDIVMPGEEGVVPGIVEKNDGVEYIRLDVRKPIEFDFTPTADDVIFNLAAVHRTPGHPDYEYFETNIRGAENVTAFAEKHNINKILFTSSIAPYGAAEELKEETTLPTPSTPYGISKLVAEKIHQMWQASVYKGYKRDKIEMRGDRADMSDFPLYLNTVAGGLDCRNQAICGFSFVVKIYALPVVKIIGQFLYLLGRYGFDAQIGYCF